MRKSSPIPVILIALLALIVFGYANNGMFKSGSHPDAEEANQAIETAMKAKQAQAAAKNSAAPGQAATTSPAITELTVGDPKTAKLRLTVGYYATDLVAENPDIINGIVQQMQNLQSAIKNSSLQVVCLDIPPADRSDQATVAIPEGLAANGKSFMVFTQDALPNKFAVASAITYIGSHYAR